MVATLQAFTERRKQLRPRPYQEKAVQSVLEAFEKGEQSALVQAATGAGKTIIFSLLIREWLQRQPELRIAVLAHRRELVAQARDKLLKVVPEVEVGMACSSLEKIKDLEKSVTIGTIQTLARQSELQAFDIIIIDEVHRLPTKNKDSQMKAFLEDAWQKNPKMKLLGVTATPFRMGHGYIYGQKCRSPESNWFKRRASHIDVETLQSEGFLSPYQYLLADGQINEDLAECAVDAFGEYEIGDLEKTVIKHEHLNSAVQTLADHALDRRSIVIFCVSITHADRLKEAFLEEGIVCESIHSELPTKQRDDTLERFNRGEIRILTNVGVLTEGWDAPRTDCVMLCRPTQSAALYVQMVGRGLRTFEGKRDCLVLDMVGCYDKHGSIRSPLVSIDDAPREELMAEGSRERHCPECREIIPLRVGSCPYCMQTLTPTVVSVDQAQQMVSVEDDSPRVVECDACQIPYRFDQLELEILSDDFSSSPLGIWYCPDEHPVKVMDETKPVEKSGEYELLHVGVSISETGILRLQCVFIDHHRNPFTSELLMPQEDLEGARAWAKACGCDLKKMKGWSSLELMASLPQGVIEARPKVTIVVTEDGCFVDFC